MKKAILFLIFSHISLAILIASDTLTAKVDERFELTSIVFRMVEAEEYINNNVASYAADIDSYFASHKNHPLIKYTKDIIRDRDEVGYDAVASSTTLLVIQNGKVKLNPRADIAKYIETDYRWKDETLKQYVKLLDDFYRKTEFRKFFQNHKGLYTSAETNLNELLKNIDTPWFESFYGKPFGEPHVYISLCNGRSNYALWDSYLKNKPNEYGIVIGCSQASENNIPMFNIYSVAPVIIHEFCHRFTNQLMKEYSSQMIDGALKMYPYVKDQLRARAYGSANAILSEGFNNLFVNMYFKEHPIGLEKHFIADNEKTGFVWMKTAVNFMDNFYINRELYPTIYEFMPQLIDLFNFTANNIEPLIKEHEMKTPRVISVFPALDSEVDTDITEIRVEFSHRMWGSMGANLSDDKTLAIPLTGEDFWSENMRVIVLSISLKENTQYGFKLPKDIYRSEDTYPMFEDFEVRFKTK